MKPITAELNKPILLGERGENLATQVRFPISDMVETYGEGTFRLLAQRAGEDPYPVSITSDESYVYWDVTSADTGIAGTGYAELQLIIDDLLAKSQTYTTRTDKALGEEGDAPNPWEGYVDTVLDTMDSKVETAQQAVTDAQAQVTLAQNQVTLAAAQAQAAAQSAQDAQEAAAVFSISDPNNDGHIIIGEVE